MTRRTARLYALAAATVSLGAVGAGTAFAETPTSCQAKYVCLADGTVFGGPAASYPDTPTDSQITARQIVEDCAVDRQADAPGVACGFYPYGEPETKGYGPWEPLTADYANCRGGNEQNNITYSDHSEYTTSNSVTVGASVEVGLSELVKASLRTDYQYTWGSSEGTTQSFSAFVPKAHKAHLQHRYQRQQVTGVLWIDYEHTGTGLLQGHGHHYWALTDFTATSPVKDVDDQTVKDQVSLSKPQPVAADDCAG
ncbi:hypothetical protein ACIPWE_39210 [Streptomyces sp. NPDC090073]|uniref:hypothetical protein n=1 Tax=Streptomyces sp. NPDC090073 TaxID=3365936 RepID=UPI003810A328